MDPFNAGALSLLPPIINHLKSFLDTTIDFLLTIK